MHPGRRRERVDGTDPVPRHLSGVLRLFGRIAVRVTPDEFAGGIQDVEFEVLCSAQDDVVDDRAVGRILSRRFIRRQRRVGVLAPTISPRGRRLE